MHTQLRQEADVFRPVTEQNWYAIQTRSRHEKMVASQLEKGGMEAFLPLCSRVRLWTDRRKIIEFPLFPSYVFVRTTCSNNERVHVLRTRGVVGFVGPCNNAAPIPADQIDNVRALLRSSVPYSPVPYVALGQRVRIRSGALQGLEGILIRVADDHSLILSIDLIRRSIAVHLHGYEVEVLGRRSN
jgi:transcription antitermination factor NusG